MKKIILSLTAITIIVLSACKKDKEFSQISEDSAISNSTEKASIGSNSGKMKPVVIYQASQSSLNNSSNTFITSQINQINNSVTPTRPGHYSLFQNSSSVISSVINNSGVCIGSAPSVEITYQVTTVESVGVIYDLTYSASLLPGTIFPIPATSYDELSSAIYDPNSATVCQSTIKTRVSNVKFIIPGSSYENSANAFIDITATSTGPAQAPFTTSESVSFTFPNAYYTGNPAIISINPDPQASCFSVGTECAIVCHSVHVICPNSGVFSYRLSGSTGPYTTINLDVFGSNGCITAAPGVYEYICTLNYGFGNSLPRTGQFTVN